jgi:hypothetical protein
MGRSDQPQERLDQRGVVLHVVHAPDAADDECVVVHEAFRSNCRRRPEARVELHAVDAVRDLRHARGLGAHLLDQPALQFGADGDEVADQRAQRAPGQLVFQALAVDVVDLAPILAVHAQPDPGQRGHQLALQAVDASRVDQAWLQGSKGAEHAHVVRQVRAFCLAQVEDLDAALAQVGLVAGVLLQAHDGVAIALARHVGDQVEQAAAGAAGVELLDHMDHQRWSFD